MNYLVVDLECTCTDNNAFPREQMEVIEIGAMLLDENLEEISEFSTFVKPTINPILEQFCKDLTKIKQSDVDAASIINDVLPEFEKWARSFGDYKFTSWGAFDYKHIQRECDLKKIINPLLQNNLNYKVRFAKIKNLKRKNGVGLQKALNIMKMKFEGIPHRAIYDAKNVVRIMKLAGVSCSG
jgi:inhibitor of KinA sporulation pathway (predicted exonuclease)